MSRQNLYFIIPEPFYQNLEEKKQITVIASDWLWLIKVIIAYLVFRLALETISFLMLKYEKILQARKELIDQRQKVTEAEVEEHIERETREIDAELRAQEQPRTDINQQDRVERIKIWKSEIKKDFDDLRFKIDSNKNKSVLYRDIITLTGDVISNFILPLAAIFITIYGWIEM